MKDATKIGFLVMVSAAVAMIVAGCAKVPQTEVDAAKTAIESAKAADAETYAPESFTAAMNAYTALDNELKAQEQLSGLKKKYDNALTLAADAKSAGEKATADAGKAKEAMKTEVTELIAAIQTSFPVAKEMIEKASKMKGVKLDVKALNVQMENGMAVLDEAQKDLEAGKYVDAKTKAEAVKGQLAAGEELVKSAVEAVSKPAKKK